MKLHELGRIYPELKGVLEKFPNFDLYPPQEEAVKRKALEKRFLLASGTATGKTLIAILASVREILAGKKVVYLVPLRALAFEKFEEFSKLGFKVAISVGDFDTAERELEEAEVIVCTYEKFDALLRHRVSWISQVGLVVADEVHELGRKPVVETILAKMKSRKVLALSATIGNVEELASWLKAGFVKSNFRPVPLKEAYLSGNLLVFRSGEKIELSSAGIPGLVEFALRNKKQVLIFANTRRRAESLAEKLSKITQNFIEFGERAQLFETARKVLKALESPTKQCKKLAELITKGIAFHHAGLANEQRLLVEKAFKLGSIKVLASTVTLVAGVNLPSDFVVVDNPSFRGKLWSVSLYKQAAGRAGRPGLSEIGFAVLRTNEKLARYYWESEPEPVTSTLAFEPVLRKEILGLFAGGFAFKKQDVFDFMKETFYAYQFGDIGRLNAICEKIIAELEAWEMLENERITELGRRVAELYIDPFNARKWLELYSEDASDFALLHLLSFYGEIDLPSIGRNEAYELMSLLSNKEFLVKPPKPWDYEFERFLRAGKLALIVLDWINEAGEDEILEKFGVAPGDLRNYVTNMEWHAYSLKEVLKAKKMERKRAKKLWLRVKHGVKEDLLELVIAPGIGRKRARKLMNAGISLRNFEERFEVAKKLVGEGIARKVLEWLRKSYKGGARRKA